MAHAGGGSPANWKRVCIFVDGENFRFSLKDLFAKEKYLFKKQDYLPDADWHAFFKSLVNRPGWDLVRVYWYVTREIDFWPRKVPYKWEQKRAFLESSGILRMLTISLPWRL